MYILIVLIWMFHIYIVLCSNMWRLGQRYGFVMTGHCFGGLVIKSLMEEAQKSEANQKISWMRKLWHPQRIFCKISKASCFMQFPIWVQSYNHTSLDPTQLGLPMVWSGQGFCRIWDLINQGWQICLKVVMTS